MIHFGQNLFIMILRIQDDTLLTINMHSIAWHINTQSYNVSEKGWGKATLEKSLEVQLRGNSSPRGTAGTQTRPWTEIYQDRTSQLMRISTGWRAGLAAPVCQLQLILFSFKMWINTNCKEDILHILKVTVLRCAGSGINDIISSGSTKQFVRGWGWGGKGGGIF